jgi:hypothetical protein
MMHSQILFKSLLLLPAILFLDYLFMIFFGCVSCSLGCGNEFFCGPYCMIGKIILVLCVVSFFAFILPDIRTIIKSRYNVASSKA